VTTPKSALTTVAGLVGLLRGSAGLRAAFDAFHGISPLGCVAALPRS
jgi:hypothetical protein